MRWATPRKTSGRWRLRKPNEGMTRYRARAVLLLFLLLNLTACSTWQSIDTISPAQFIEEDQPDRVRVLLRGGNELELENPSVEGDELVAPGVSMPLADILRLEVLASSRGRTAGWVVAGLAVISVAQGKLLGVQEYND